MAKIYLIEPYKHEGLWVVDDPSQGLYHEPFVSGANTLVDYFVKDLPDAEKGFRITFSDAPFPNHCIELDWENTEFGGNWYCWPQHGIKGWFGPSLYHYFAEPPKVIYVRVEEK